MSAKPSVVQQRADEPQGLGTFLTGLVSRGRRDGKRPTTTWLITEAQGEYGLVRFDISKVVRRKIRELQAAGVVRYSDTGWIPIGATPSGCEPR